MGATEKRRERACGGAMAEGIGVLDGECEGWAVYQEWVGGGWVVIVRSETQILNKSGPVFAMQADFLMFAQANP
ncbi:hypothetical protein RS3R2_25290 [Pseudomonas lactis]|nr:hypothetical protein RS3R2_25290 [Pseudomonas lactis]